MVKKVKEIAEIIANAKKGDEASFTWLLNTYWKDVFRYMVTKTNDENGAEDLTIRSFARAFDRIETFDDNYEFKNWILTIANNLHIDQLRKPRADTVSIHKEKYKAYSIQDEEPTPVDQLIIEQNLARLLAYIKELKPHYQEMIQLRFFQEMSYKEMARELNEPVNNIKVKLLRAKKLLAEIITNTNS